MIKILQFLLIIFGLQGFGQPIKIFKQFTGPYDFLMIGNTMNSLPNGTNNSCTVLTQSNAKLTLQPNQKIIAAYLYWSGSGGLSQADLQVQLNGNEIKAERTFTAIGPSDLPFFGAFANVTNLVKATGSAIYSLSNFDLTNVIAPYCTSGSNYAGWSIFLVYEDAQLLNRVVSIYDGFQLVDNTGANVLITLNGLNVTNVTNAKVGFLAWEGDEDLAVAEELKINNKIVSNAPLNPLNNAFNGTNSFTGLADLWNMDLDYYNVGNFLELGDTEISVQIKTQQDLVIINNIAVALNSLFADASMTIDDVEVMCDSRIIKVNYSVFNDKGNTRLLPSVPIAFYADKILLGTTSTKASLQPKETQKGFVMLTIPENIPNNFVLTAVIDDNGTGMGNLIEINENNNIVTKKTKLITAPKLNKVNDLVLCDTNNNGFVVFDLLKISKEICNETNVLITFHESKKDALNGTNAIVEINKYQVKTFTENVIWVRAVNKLNGCTSFASFKLTAQMKPFGTLNELLNICNYQNNPKAVNLNLVTVLLGKLYDYTHQVQLKFYETEFNATENLNEIKNTVNYQPPTFPFTIWVRVLGNDKLANNIIHFQVNNCVIPQELKLNESGLYDNLNLDIFKINELKIYNKHGNLIYEHGNGYTNQWNGQDKDNKPLPQGTYFYIFRNVFDTFSGKIQLIDKK